MMTVFNQINFKNLHGDLLGGATAAVIALPMALAFGVASGAGAEVGLYGAILVGLFAALFGGTPTLISEPTGPMTVVFTAVITTLIAADPDQGMAMAFTVVIMAGIVQILFGLMKLGKFVTLMPYSVVSGFMSGIGFILIILQFGPMLGHANPAGGVIAALQNIPTVISQAMANEIVLGLMTLLILFALPTRLKRYMPPQLLALLLGTLVSILLMSHEDVRRIGEIPAGLPQFNMPAFSAEQWLVMSIDALVLGMLGSIDALLTSVIADSLTKSRHNSDKELIGQGIGNVMSGLFGGLPGAGATMGTVVNIQTGARTALSGLFRAGILLVIVIWASGLTAYIPLAVLAGIALKVGIDIIDWRFLKRAHRLSIKAAGITYAVILLTIFVDLIAAVGIGLFIANVMTITKLSEMQKNDIAVFSGLKQDADGLSAYEKDLLDTAADRVKVVHLQGSMIFGVSRAISEANAELSDAESLIIDLSKVSYLGVSSALSLEEMIKEACGRKQNVLLVFNQDNQQPHRRLDNLGIISALPDKNIVYDRRKALETAIYA